MYYITQDGPNEAFWLFPRANHLQSNGQLWLQNYNSTFMTSQLLCSYVEQCNCLQTAFFSENMSNCLKCIHYTYNEVMFILLIWIWIWIKILWHIFWQFVAHLGKIEVCFFHHTNKSLFLLSFNLSSFSSSLKSLATLTVMYRCV